MSKSAFLLLSVLAFNFLKAQSRADNVQAIIDAMRQLHTAYDSGRYLSFNVAYTYADVNAPDQILDSISGLIQINNNRYHWQIGTTETVANEHYAIMLFKEDKVMYITKPFAKSGEIDPLAKLDSSLLLINGLQTSIKMQKNMKFIKLNFPPESGYKSIQLLINKKTGFLNTVDFIVKPESIGNYGMADSKNIKAAYVHIKANYSNYKKDSIDDSIFNESNYFIKNISNFNTVSKYKDYKIFIGSPNL